MKSRYIALFLISVLAFQGNIVFANESLCQKFTDAELVAFRELQEFETSRSPLYFAGSMLPFLTGIAAGRVMYKKVSFGSPGFQYALDEWRRNNPKAIGLKAWDPSLRLPKMISTLMGLEYLNYEETTPFKKFFIEERGSFEVSEKNYRDTSFEVKVTGVKSSEAFTEVANAILEIDKNSPKIKDLMKKIHALNSSYQQGSLNRLESKEVKFKKALHDLREDLIEERFKALRNHPKFKKIVDMLDPNGFYYKGNFRSKVLYLFTRAERILNDNLKLLKKNALISVEAKRIGGAAGGAVGGVLTGEAARAGAKKLLQMEVAREARVDLKKCPKLKMDGWDDLYIDKGYINIVNCKPELSIYGEDFLSEISFDEEKKENLPTKLRESAILCEAFLGLTEKRVKKIKDVSLGEPEISCGNEIEIKVKDEKCGKDFYYKLERNRNILSLKSGFIPGEQNLTLENSFAIDIAVNKNELDLFFNNVRTNDLSINQTIPVTQRLTDTLIRSNPMTFLDSKNELNKCEFLKSPNDLKLPGNTYFKMIPIRQAVVVGKLFLVDAMEKCNWNADSFKLVVPGFESSTIIPQTKPQ